MERRILVDRRSLQHLVDLFDDSCSAVRLGNLGGNDSRQEVVITELSLECWKLPRSSDGGRKESIWMWKEPVHFNQHCERIER
jgi:hypothetical protein